MNIRDDIVFIRSEADQFLIDEVEIQNRMVTVSGGIEVYSYSAPISTPARISTERYYDKESRQVVLHTNNYKLQLPFNMVNKVSRLDRVTHSTITGVTVYTVTNVPDIHEYTGVFIINIEKVT